MRAEVVGVSVPDTPEGVRDLAATNPGDSSPGAQREQQRAKEELRRHQKHVQKRVDREAQRQRDRDHYLRVTVPLLEAVERQRQADRVKWAAEREVGKPSPLQPHCGSDCDHLATALVTQPTHGGGNTAQYPLPQHPEWG